MNIPIEFSISVVGEVTGETYAGVFKAFPRLSHSKSLLKDQMRRDLLGPKGEEANQEAMNVAVAFSTIWAHLTGETPSWFKDSNRGLDLFDETPIAFLYNKILEMERDANVTLKKQAEDAKKALEATVKE
jgi:hypothetical protein